MTDICHTLKNELENWSIEDCKINLTHWILRYPNHSLSLVDGIETSIES
jgi:hypothetical protein